MITNRAMGRLVLVVPLLLAALVMGPAHSAAAAYSCSSQVYNQTITTSIVVPDGENCELYGVVVKGGVTVGAGGGLYASSSEIRGSVSGSGIYRVHLNYSTVRGNMAVSGVYYVTVFQTEVRGNFIVSGADDDVEISGSSVSGSVTLSNFGPDGEGTVRDSVIRVNLICSSVPGGIYDVASASVGNQVILTNCQDNGEF